MLDPNSDRRGRTMPGPSPARGRARWASRPRGSAIRPRRPAIARLISSGGGGGAAAAPGMAAPQYAHAGVPTRSGAPQLPQRVSWLAIGGEDHSRGRHGLGTWFADHGGPD